MQILKLVLLPLLAVMTPVPASSQTSDAATPVGALPSCDSGALKQGGLLLCHGEPGTTVKLNGSAAAIFDETGRASIGLATNAPSNVNVSLPYQGGMLNETLTIAPRKDEYRELTGLDCDKVDARTKEQIDHAGRSWVSKQNAFAKFNAGAGLSEGVTRPTDLVMSSPFGPTRKYTGVSKTSGESCNSTSVHRGYDMATPIGTPVKAPADGVIILADPDLYYEGGCVFLDHGQGLISIVMHLSEVDVKVGDVVKAGDVIAKTGNSGRTTGPHLHWAVKWRNTASEDRDGDFYIDPALLLEMQ